MQAVAATSSAGRMRCARPGCSSENVREFTSWGPLGANGRPLVSKRGVLFRQFVSTLEALGYRVEWRVLNAADYGAATTRQRLFMVARLGRAPIPWPVQTHAPVGQPGLFASAPWRAAREVIDWSLRGRSIFEGKPLAEKTLARIAAGARRFWGVDLEPFLVVLRQNADARSLDRPLPTVATKGAISLIEPFLVKYFATATGAQSIHDPLDTVTTRDRHALVSGEAGDARLDIRIRMLQPHELAAGQGFPIGYRFAGNKTEQTKQIGNAVEVNQARALFTAMLAERRAVA